MISGFGRLGRWFGCERYGFTPDLMTCAKGISSGYVPLGAVVVAGRVREPFWHADAAPFVHGGTYAGHPARASRRSRTSTSSSVSDSSSASRRSSRSSPRSSRRRSLPGVADVRTAGLAAGIELDPELLAGAPAPVLPSSEPRGARVS